MEPLIWHSEIRNVKDLKHWDKNPRKITKEAFAKLKERITKRGFHDVLKLDIDDTVLSGNRRQDALNDLKIEKVNVLVPNRKLTDKERDEIALESNKNDGTWDFDMLANEFELETLQDIGFSDGELGIELSEENPYTKKIEAPIYKPENTKPPIKELYDKERYAKLISEIRNSSLSQEEKDFLEMSATRHVVFNYQKIADFYAHSSKECQNLMENSALVIIDFEKAVELGYVNLSEEISNQYMEEHGNEE